MRYQQCGRRRLTKTTVFESLPHTSSTTGLQLNHTGSINRRHERLAGGRRDHEEKLS